MTSYLRYNDFTAQAINVRALMSLYADLERGATSSENVIPIVVFIAFSIESYLNSLGARKLEFWDEVERLPWKSKVEILHKVANKSTDWGREPLQFAAEVFKLRDKLAHGKPERVFDREVFGHTLYESANDWHPQPAWFNAISKEWALEAKLRLHKLMIYLSSLFDLHESDYLHTSTIVLVPQGGGSSTA